ncbi:MAG: DUF2177 family protein [Acidobacteria bacterium]|nr:DUF2177 family protein [Acidobacteriota bacterium]NIM61771.1 DUF2177 family protein [Acidobacteriota bacterium]NIO60015.1 DUF2177 family protein [Acidobacteriota bacterium]NIQ29207.1 DUF2177 family protein [Acidobacteriota bacterium]NIQ83781.1 DUF2177 family protein [Acidobacteriota bacterium]
MSPVQFIKLFLLTAVVFFAIDLVWIGVVAAQFYERHLGAFLAPRVRWGAAILFYVIYIVGLLVFAVLPGLSSGSLARAAALGAFLGFMAYATFDLTCLALFRDFPVKVVVVDLAWGTLLSATVTSAAYGIGRWLGIG